MNCIGLKEYEKYYFLIEKNNILCVCEEEEEYSYNSKVNNLHDKLFRDILNQKEQMINILKRYLNVEINEKEIEQYNSNYITEKYKDKQSDIVYKLKDKNIYFLVEHQSSVDKEMPIRIMEYSIELIRQTIQNDSNSKPSVIPIVIYTGKEKWRVEKEYIKKKERIGNEQVDKLGINVKYNLININEITKRKLIEEKTLIADAMLIEKIRTREEVSKIIREIINNTKEEQKETMERILRYGLIRLFKENEIEDFIKKLYEKGEEEAMSMLDENLKKDEEKIMNKGKKEGMKEGMKEGRREREIEILKLLKQEGVNEKIIKKIECKA